jgi:pSer/pThr/pTyr-binding forkhead associated (FHA) protein
MAKVVVKFGDKVLGEVALSSPEVTIGRSPENDIHIDNLAVSNFHARIIREGSQYFIQDLGSLNGTFVDGQKVEIRELLSGDDITIAKHTLSFELGDDAPAPSRAQVDSLELDQTMVLDTRKHQKLSKRQFTPVAEGSVGVLVVDSGKAEAPEFVMIDSHMTIGKAREADFHIRGFFAPAVACYLQRTDEGYFVSPPEGGKKPVLNGEKVGVRARLAEGDTLEAGGVRMRFIIRKMK